MKVLLTASVLSHICQFHKPLIGLLKEAGHSVHIAARNNLTEKNGLSLPEVDEVYDINFHRNPFSPKNIPAYLKLKKIIDTQRFDIIHCNTPAVGVLTRLAARKTRKQNNTRVFYTAHGFHFYKGAPLKNWILYYPIEKLMCRFTDTLITITEEDYKRSSAYFKVNTVHIHGVGADSSRFTPVTKEEQFRLRDELSLPTDSPIILCTGELLKNKNQATLLKSLPEILKLHPNLLVLLAGNGPEQPNLEQLAAELGITKHVKLLGYRTDLEKLVKAADIIVSCSFREGLPLNIIEGMLCARPIVASANRGHNELIADRNCGLLFPPGEYHNLAKAVITLLNNPDLINQLSLRASKHALRYTDTAVVKELRNLYK